MKNQLFIPIPKKGSAKECVIYCTTLLISHTSKVILKMFHAKIKSMWTNNFQMYNQDLENVEEPDVKFLASAES